MKRERLLPAIIVIGLLSAPLTQAWADESYGHGKGGCGESHGGFGGYGTKGHSSAGHLLRGLLGSQKEFGLTDEQVAKLKALQLDLDKTRIRLEADIMIAEREAAALIEDDKSDLAAIEAKIKQVEDGEASLRMAAIKTRREAMGVLTSEQSARIKAVHERIMRERLERKKDGESGRTEGHGMMKGHMKMEPKKGEDKKDGH
jgi:Spy/CpxP family protein refolding chaperone